MAIVKSENYESWKWFLELLIADLDLQDGHRKTLISVQQKVTEEVHLKQQEIFTGEEELMNETLANMEGSQVRDESIPLEEEDVPDNVMKFMPTPSLRKHTGTGCTPPVSTPPTRKEQVKKNTPRKRVATSSKTVKAFAPPRKK
ncbi:hypothetical protein POM88_035516 [Heracleum sosnowskyi]|uniref:Uncharacterized protein n=1 Tax=Heracleum sosnowskyi TaxID=360622 RepID=A0AAD8ME62_9APIA|nr:hypothetical protein POM88_035516 [Heracleum sosnowskyi]